MRLPRHTTRPRCSVTQPEQIGKRKTKIMALVPTMRTGGAEKVISLLLQQLDRERYEPHLVIVYDAEIAFQIPQDVPVHVLEHEPPAGAPACRIDLPVELADRFASQAEWMTGTASRFIEVVRREKPDIVISSPLWASILAVVSHDFLPPQTRLISRVDAPPSVSLSQGDLSDLFRFFMREHFNKSDRAIAVSKAVGRDLVENFGVDADRIEVVNNPVDLSRIDVLKAEPVDDDWFTEGVPVVVAVGRLERVKGLEYLLRAIALVGERRDVRLALVGDGTHRGYLTALVKHLGIEKSVRFIGRQPNPFKYLKNSTLFVLSSISEGMPNVILEAMACGCPVIATDINGGISREVLNEGEYGIITPLRDEVSMAAAIERMLDNPVMRQRLSFAGLERAKEYDLPKVMLHNEAVIDRVAEMAVVALDDAAGFVPPMAFSASEEPDPPEAIDETSTANAVAPTVVAQLGIRALAGRFVRRLLRIGDASPEQEVLPRRRYPDKVGVLVVVPSLDNEYIGTGVEEILKRLDRDLFEVTLVCTVPSREGDVPDDVARVCLAPTCVVPYPSGVLASDIESTYGDRLDWIATVASALADVADKMSADVVLAQGFESSIATTLSQEFFGGTFASVISIQNRACDFADTLYGGDMYTALMARHFPHASAVIARDQAVAEDMRDAFGVDVSNLSVIPDPIDLSRALGADAASAHPWLGGSTPVFLAVLADDIADSNLVLAAVESARKRGGVFRILLAGTGTWRDAARGSCATAGLAEFVDILDDGISPRHLLGCASGLLWVSVSDAQSVPPLVVDASTLGRPVVVVQGSDVVREFLGQGSRGILVPRADSEALGDAILQLTWDPEGADMLSSAASEYVAPMDADVVVKRVTGLLTTMAGKAAQNDVG